MLDRRRAACRLVVLAGTLLTLCAASAQAGPELSGVERPLNVRPSEALVRAIEADYLSEDERRAMRVGHGLWGVEDLVTPADRALAAVDVGAYSDASLDDPSVPTVLRAEAQLRRGDLEEALTTLAGDTTPRGVRIRLQALEGLGRFGEVEGAAGDLEGVARAARGAQEIADVVLAMMVRSRTAGQRQGGGQDYQLMNSLLTKARDASPLEHGPRLAEAILLMDKDNDQEAQDAALEALRLNPSLAAGFRLLGDQAVASFDFDRAERVADDLDRLVRALGEDLVSIDAGIVRAKARLRQSDASGAEEELQRVLAVYPRQREALALLAGVSAQRFDFEAVERAHEEFSRFSPGSPGALYAAGRQCSDSRQYAEGAGLLARAADLQPNWGEVWIALGLLYIQWGDDGRAEIALERAFELDPFNLRADNSLRLVRKLKTFESVESDHFTVRHAPGIDSLLAREMPAVLERIYARVAGEPGFDHEPAARTRIELMPDHQSFAVRIVGMPQVHTIAASTGPLIAMEPPREGAGRTFPVYDWPRVVQHEFAHTVTLSRSNNRLPHWFTEAAAVSVEDAPRDYSRCILLTEALRHDALFNLDEISLRFVRPIRPTDRAQAYAQGHWMYEYIVQREGMRAILDMLDLYAEGRTQREVFERVLGEDQGDFMARFEEWAHGQVIEWGMAPAEGTPSMEEALSGLRASVPVDENTVANDAPGPTREELEAMLESYPEHPDILESLVEVRLKGSSRNLTAETVALLERYARARPVDPLPHKRLAAHHLSPGGNPHLAVEHLEFLDAREQYSIDYAAELARLYAARRDERAVEKARRAVSLAPFDAPTRELAATVALLFERADEALGHLEALTVIEPEREIHKRRLEALRARMNAGG